MIKGKPLREFISVNRSDQFFCFLQNDNKQNFLGNTIPITLSRYIFPFLWISVFYLEIELKCHFSYFFDIWGRYMLRWIPQASYKIESWSNSSEFNLPFIFTQIDAYSHKTILLWLEVFLLKKVVLFLEYIVDWLSLKSTNTNSY